MKKYKSDRKYRCPFCDHMDVRHKLVEHVIDEHEEMIPEDMTAAQVVFNYLNNRTEGPLCQSCGKPTKWNEEKWRYDAIHIDDPKCVEIAAKKAEKNMIKARGMRKFTGSAENQNKMLSGRSISGTYTFSTGQQMGYVGTYERKFLEFCDQVLHLVPYVDIFDADWITKHPEFVVYYKYKGKTHIWILDYYIKPFDAMIDCKDGGDNKNNREMTEYREKQVEKEKAIAKQGKFNYLRLTDNQFGQLLSLFLDVKYSLTQPEDKTKIHINENKEIDSLYCIAYSESGLTVDGYGVMTNKLCSNVFVSEDGNLKLVNQDFFKDKVFTIYEYTKDDKQEVYTRICNMLNDSVSTDYMSLYEELCGGGLSINESTEINILKPFYTSTDGRMYQDILQEMVSYSYRQRISPSVIHNGIHVLDEDKQKIVSGHSSLELKEEVDGFYIENVETHNRSKAFKNINEIQPVHLYIMESKF